MKQVMSTIEVAAQIGYSEKYVQAKGDSGELPIKFRTSTGARYFDPDDVAVFKQRLEELARLGRPRRGRPRKQDIERRRQLALQQEEARSA